MVSCDDCTPLSGSTRSDSISLIVQARSRLERTEDSRAMHRGTMGSVVEGGRALISNIALLPVSMYECNAGERVLQVCIGKGVRGNARDRNRWAAPLTEPGQGQS